MKANLMIAAIAAVLLVPSALADNFAGLSMAAGSSGNSKQVTFTVKLTARTHNSGPGGKVVFTDCKAGLGLPLPVEPDSYSVPAKTRLVANNDGLVQWDFPSVPPAGDKPLTLKLTYSVPPHTRPYSVCLRADATQNVSKLTLGMNMRFFLWAAK